MTLLLSFMWRKFRPFPSIWLNFMSHRALQKCHQSHTAKSAKTAKTGWNSFFSHLNQSLRCHGHILGWTLDSPFFHFLYRQFKYSQGHRFNNISFQISLVNFNQQCMHFKNMVPRIIWLNSMYIPLKMPCFLYFSFWKQRFFTSYYSGCMYS